MAGRGLPPWSVHFWVTDVDSQRPEPGAAGNGALVADGVVGPGRNGVEPRAPALRMPKLPRCRGEQETATVDHCDWLFEGCPALGPGSLRLDGLSGLARLDQLRRTARSVLHLERFS